MKCPHSLPEFQPFLIGLKITHTLMIVNTKASLLGKCNMSETSEMSKMSKMSKLSLLS